MSEGRIATTEESRRLWRLMILAAICVHRDGRPAGITTPSLQRGLPLLGDSVVYGCIKSLEDAGFIVGRSAPSGHPSGSKVIRWMPAPGVALDVDI